jgi:hypothetical protein
MIIRQADGTRIRADELADDPNLRGRPGATGKPWPRMTSTAWQATLADLRDELGKTDEQAGVVMASASSEVGRRRWRADADSRHTVAVSGGHVGSPSDKQEDDMTVNMAWSAGGAEITDLDPITPTEHWDLLLGEGTHKELAAQVRYYRDLAKLTRDRDERRNYGQCLYELQVALKTRFRIDIAKIR